MNTPTPEQLKEFESFLKEANTTNTYDLCTAYANHVLTNHEGFQSNAELKSKLAELQEEVKKWKDIAWNRYLEIHQLQQKLTASQERVKKLEEKYDIRNKANELLKR